MLETRSNHPNGSSTVRSQDGALINDQASSDTPQSAAADYGQLQSRFGTSQPDSAVRLENAITATGHSFVKPKARLGRPIPVPNEAVIPTDAQVELGHQDTSPNTTQANESIPDNTREVSGRTPWPLEHRAAWQPIKEVDPSWSQVDETFSGARTDTPAPPPNAFPPSPTTSENLQQTADTSIDVGAMEPIAGNPVSAENASDHTTTVPSSGSNTELAPAPEPTMLDRFRGLYAPRLEDNTDKLRKQIRRWPDPFGLLKDREENTESIPGGVPSAAENEASSTAVVPHADTSPTTNESKVSPLDTVIADLETALAEWPGTPSGKPERLSEWRQRQTDLRLLYMVAGHSAESIRVIESLPDGEQEFWQSLMLSMNGYREIRNDTSREEQLSQVLDHLRDASRKLQPLSTLQIRHMTFCDRIDGFGNVAAFPTADFNPGQRILVYADVQNFRSELTPEGNYRSEFAAVIEFMRQGDDEIVETIRLPQILDHCNVERTDYFQSFELTLPALAGTYTVRIRLRDQLSLQTAESQLEFHVRSQNSGL